MNVQSVAKITPELAEEIGVDYKDSKGNFVISLQLAQQLEPEEFEVVSVEENELEGTLPVDPTKPLIRPKKK